MTGHYPDEYAPYEDAELDRLLTTATKNMHAGLEATFDPDAGLADVFARAAALKGEQRQAATGAPQRHSRADHDTVMANSRLQDVCDRIDAYRARLAAAGQTPVPGAAYLTAACNPLIQLRMGLAGRDLTKNAAQHLMSTVEEHIAMAERTERSDLMRTDRPRFDNDLPAEAHTIREMVMRLYDSADDAAPLIPAG